MKRISLLACLFLVTTVAHADLLIFRGTYSAQYTGHGSEGALKTRTITIVDVDGTNATVIETAVLRGQKRYHVNNTPGSVFGATLRGANGRTYHVSADASSITNEFTGPRIRSLFVRGLETRVTIKPGRVLNGPRVSRGRVTSLEQQSGEYGMMDATVSRTVSQAETVDANARGETVEAAAARIIQKLESQGYINS